jgi:type IV pilus assembly protein PilA
MSHRRKQWRMQQGGFTLIELLVVVLVIGILASIAIPAFLGQRRKAQDTAAKALLRSGVIAAESYYVENNQAFANLVAGLLSAQEQNVAWQDPTAGGWTAAEATADEVDVYPLPAPATADSYVLATTSRTGTVFSYVRDPSGAAYRCSGTTPATATAGCVGTYAGGW